MMAKETLDQNAKRKPGRPRKQPLAQAARWVGVDVVTAHVGVSRDLLMAEVKRGNFPPPVRIGQLLRWDLTAVDQWLVANASATAKYVPRAKQEA